MTETARTEGATAAGMVDQPGRVRAGEELDVGRIDAFLKAADPGLRGVPEVLQFPGGASNLTYLLAYPEHDLILRRPPFGHKAKSAHDMLREARVMQALRPIYPYVPQVKAICDDPDVLGCDFFVMERIRGIIPRQDMPAGLSLTPQETRRLCLSVIDRLIELHAIDPVAAGLGELGRGDGYVRRQVEGWSDRYRKVRTPDSADFETVMGWLADRMPATETAIRIVHNDFRFDNVVLDPDEPIRVIGVLDWEMATLGDPLMDLGNSLAYWVQADDDPTFLALRRQPTHLPGMLTRAEVIAYYGERTGLPVDDMDFYMVYGLFRLAVIVQQIYYRYAQGQTSNPQFAGFGKIARYLEKRCLAAIGSS
ncbi:MULTISPECIES: phosphotransferase family protein [Alphaproteobacteria]|uniref:Phosphotransferase family protein n=2 Tax=Alphaproteobacteria TaxID=28211 RepID=A0A512HGY9_9HYPH|nr:MULTISPECIES: phosphotransferase family protein [Alphaproteobacteria]GEO84702.1 phosphotransferase family protein [Ciceribacter naphthalenivorans]GLR20677.1 phosphotransferase family protein [Ciceribacter naphthalenivorans]GLT03533.1 phosphotransferase family protein [Sphingomonas psychrolutea]